VRSADTTADYSIVVPVFRNEQSLARAVERLERLQESVGAVVEGVFVVDGSPDASAIVLARLLPQATIRSQLIVLSRNFGAFSAIRAGLAASTGRIVAIMAADLQEPEELYVEFYAALAAEDAFVAVGRRRSRSDPPLQSLLARTYWWLFRRLVIREIPPGGVDVFAARRQVVDELVRLHESHTSLIGMLFNLGFPRVEVDYDRVPRHEGRSSWSLARRMRYLLDSVFSFTDLPIIAITLAGLVGSFASVIVAIVVTVGWVVGRIDVPGYTPIVLAITLSSSLVLFSLGVLGSYVWRTYENSKGRPGWIPMQHTSYPSARVPASDDITPDTGTRG
jgi:glycosyltransferase involved in cell wall biosynthesis